MNEKKSSGNVFEHSPFAAVTFVQHVPVRTIGNTACKIILTICTQLRNIAWLSVMVALYTYCIAGLILHAITHVTR